VGVGVELRRVRHVVRHVGRVATRGQHAPVVGAARAARAEEAAVLAHRAPARTRVVRTGVAPAAEPAVAGPYRLFLGVLDRQGGAAAVVRRAGGEGVLLGGAIAFAVLAVVGVGLGPFEAVARDDVHHAGDRVGAVDRRRA